MHAMRHIVQFTIFFDVIEQVHAKVVETQVGYGHTSLQVFQLDDFLLQAPQLFLAVWT